MDLIYLWEFSEKGNKYKKVGFRKVKLMKLNQNAKEIEGEVINDGIKYKVVSYDKNFFDDFKNKELTLQKGMNLINFHLSNPNKFLKRLTINVMGSPNTPYLLWCFPNLRSLEIESSNRFIVKENDILYSKPRCSICFISKKMKRLFIRESIRSIKSYACHNSPLLTTIYFPISLTFIGNGSFKNCERLEKVHFPPNLSFLGPSAFSGCRNLKIVSFKKCQKLKTIKKLTFASTGIEKIVLPKCLMIIDMSAFVFCHALKEIGFEEGSNNVKFEYQIDYIHMTKVKLKIPYSWTVITSSFNTVTKIYKIAFPKLSIWNIQKIEARAFKSMSYKLFYVPKSVEYIGEEAFADNGLLEKIIFMEGSQLEYCHPTAFEGCYNLRRLVYSDVNILKALNFVGDKIIWSPSSNDGK